MIVRLPKRIVYVPGMISLVMLPLLINTHIRQYTKHYRQHAIMLLCETRKGCCLGCDEPERKYVSINLTGNHLYDKQEIEASKKLIQKIRDGADTVGIHYNFSTTATYSTLIAVCNELFKEKADNYHMNDKGIWFPGNPQPDFIPIQSNHSFNRKQSDNSYDFYTLRFAKGTLFIIGVCFIVLLYFAGRRI